MIAVGHLTLFAALRLSNLSSTNQNPKTYAKTSCQATVNHYVKKAKDSNVDGLPDVIFENGTKLNQNQHASAFANFFSEKVNSIVI